MFGIWCMRSSLSVCGSAAAWAKDRDGNIILTETKEEAQEIVNRYKKDLSPFSNVNYRVQQYN